VAFAEDPGMTHGADMTAIRRYGLTIAFGLWLIQAIASPAVARPLDACALAPADAAPAPRAPPSSPDPAASPPATAPEPATPRVIRIIGPTSFETDDGRTIALAGIATPHRFPLGASTTEETADLAADALGEPTLDRSPMDQPPDAATPAPDAAAKSALSAWLIGERVTLHPIAAPPDRYGRLRAHVERLGDGIWIEAALVERGLARVQPQSDDFGCARRLEAIEADARAARRGLWALPEFAVVAADDPARDRWVGHYVLIEGTVISLGNSGGRHYLNFGRNFSRDFAIVLADKGTGTAEAKAGSAMRRFQLEGFDAPGVKGRRIRVRGVLMQAGGGLILPSVPEEIEWVQVEP